MIGYQWRPIEDLPPDWRETLASSELAGLFGVWKERVVELKDSPAYQEFMARLRREWAIETGIIEGLYDIDRGVTRTLIEHGLHASLIAHGDANKPAEQIIPMLKDHENVVEGLFDFVGQQRQLSTSYIKQIHQALTTHQETATGVDSLGKTIEIPLMRGEWKKWPNNPTRPDGQIHEFCPPEQTASEMDRLIEMHLAHLEAGVPPEVEAAWLHHRFTQIHPFQDGNGRVARALASLVFIRVGWFPFVVHRDTRSKYIESLEKADESDLGQLVTILGAGQKKAFNQAISISDSLILPQDSVEQIIAVGVRTLKEKEASKSETQRIAILYKGLAEQLWVITHERLMKAAKSLKEQLSSLVDEDQKFVDIQNYDYRKNWDLPAMPLSSQVATQYGLVINGNDEGWWGCLYIGRTNGLALHVSFFSAPQDQRVGYVIAYSSRNGEPPVSLTYDAFQFALNESLEFVIARYKRWLEDALIVGFAEWRKRL